MAKIVDASVDIIKQGVQSLKTLKKDKQEYKEQVARVNALPEEYRFVYNKSCEYMWSYCGGGDGYDMLSLHSGLLELFEASVALGKPVTQVTGDDVAAFCDGLLTNAKTYTEDRRAKLNRDIAKKLGNLAK